VGHSLPDGSLVAKAAPLKSARAFSDSDSFGSLFASVLSYFFRKLKYYLEGYRYP